MPSHIEHRTYRLVTSLSYDLVNSTELMRSLGIEAYALLLEQIHHNFKQVVQAAGGWADLPQGDDGCMCYFGAHQVQPQAKNAALSVALALQKLANENSWDVRLGLAYGEVAVLNEQPIGPSIHMAARLQKLAQVRQILVSPELAAQTSEQFVLRSLPTQQVCKGFDSPIQALELLSYRQAIVPGAFMDRNRRIYLHGRQKLLKDLRQVWGHVQGGQTFWVQILGEAGIGKTALIQEFVQQVLLPQSRAMAFVWHCNHDRQQTPYHPVVQAIMAWACIGTGDDVATREDKLSLALQDLPLSAQQRWALFSLLDLSVPEQRAQAPEDPHAYESHLLQGLLVWLRQQSRHGPFVLLIEDLHWADSSTLRLLGLLFASMPGMPAAVLTTQRPVALALPDVAATTQQVRKIRLQELDFEESCALIRELWGPQMPSPDMVEWIAERAVGVPLFIHEAVRLWSRPGQGQPPKLNPIRNSLPLVWMQQTQPADTMSYGTREILMQRMDALGGLRWLAQLSSVIAAEFTLDLLLHVAAASGIDAAQSDVMAQVDALVDGGFLVREPQGHETVYRHSHALLREVAYQSIWATDRQRLHALILKVYDQRDPQFVQTNPAIMAQHWLAAGEPEQAVAHFAKAAQLSRRKGAHSVSIDCCEAALQLLNALPARSDLQELQLQMAMLAAGQIMATHGYGTPRAGAYFQQALSLSFQLEDGKAQAKAQLGMHSYHLLRGEFDAAEHCVQDGLQNPQTRDDALTHLLWQFARAMLAFYRGQMQTCADTMHMCQQLSEAVPQVEQLIQSPQVMSLMYRAFCLWALGETETATVLGRQGVALADQHPLRLAKIQAHGIQAMLMYCRGDWSLAQAASEQALQAAEQGEYLLWTALARFVQGAAQLQLGLLHAQPHAELRQSLAQMQQADQQWADSHSVLTRPFFLTTLAQCQMLMGDLQAAQQHLDEANTLVVRHGERYFATELQRTQAMLWLQKTKNTTADTSRASSLLQQLQHQLEQAYTEAQQRGLHSLSLRIALSMHECEQQHPQCRAWLEQCQRALHWVDHSLQRLAADSSTQDARLARVLLQHNSAQRPVDKP